MGISHYYVIVLFHIIVFIIDLLMIYIMLDCDICRIGPSDQSDFSYSYCIMTFWLKVLQGKLGGVYGYVLGHSSHVCYCHPIIYYDLIILIINLLIFRKCHINVNCGPFWNIAFIRSVMRFSKIDYIYSNELNWTFVWVSQNITFHITIKKE